MEQNHINCSVLFLLAIDERNGMTVSGDQRSCVPSFRK